MKSRALGFKQGMYSFQWVPSSTIIWQIPALSARLEVTQVQFLGRLCRMNSWKGYPTCPQMLQRHNDHNLHKPQKKKIQGDFSTFNMAWKWINHDYSCLFTVSLFVSSKTCYHAEFLYTESGLLDKCQSASQEVAGINPGWTDTRGLWITEENVLPLLWHLQMVRQSSLLGWEKKHRLHRTTLPLLCFFWEMKEPTLTFVKSRGRTPRWCGTTLHGLCG